jgi:hypothetical protein
VGSTRGKGAAGQRQAPGLLPAKPGLLPAKPGLLRATPDPLQRACCSLLSTALCKITLRPSFRLPPACLPSCVRPSACPGPPPLHLRVCLSTCTLCLHPQLEAPVPRSAARDGRRRRCRRCRRRLTASTPAGQQQPLGASDAAGNPGPLGRGRLLRGRQARALPPATWCPPERRALRTARRRLPRRRRSAVRGGPPLSGASGGRRERRACLASSRRRMPGNAGRRTASQPRRLRCA